MGADSLRLDTLSILPSSLGIDRVPDSSYRLDFIRAVLHWIHKPAGDSITLRYRVFGYKLNPVAQRISFDSVINRDYLAPYAYSESQQGTSKGVFDFGNLRATGSFGRQIAFGNSQDAVVNSTLNMQLEGMLGDSIEVQAAITDNNIPIQPDGNTQQLNEFDQVYLQFRKKGWQLSLGDIDLRQNKNYFLNFYKRLQGISFQTTNRLSKSVTATTLVSGSVAKGKFNRNVFEGLEGNQGPYKLTGANNELFFIVLAGTERVYLDGQLLQRGEDQDYVINYNTAEVTFTPKRMITKDSRIQVEFEYADRNFLNANLYLSQELALGKKMKLRFGVFNNSDAKNSQINQVLDNRQKQFLSTLGDSIQNALYPTAALDTFAAGKVLYQKVYYNTSAGTDSFYQYSTDPAVAQYNLAFSDVGVGHGNYLPDFNGANGKVFKFVPPVNGVKQGQYEPVTILVTPKKQQVVTMGMDYAMTQHTSVKAEVAMSDFDPNTFSRLDDGHHKGYAAKFQLANSRDLHTPAKLKLNTGLDYEYVQDKFKPLERIRNVEFTRDWGLPLVTQAATENILRATAQLQDARNQSLSYQFVNYHRSDSYDGFQNNIVHQADWKGWLLNNQLSITRFNSTSQQGAFLRPVIDVAKQLKHMGNYRIGFNYSLQQNKARDKVADTLGNNSFYFDTYSVYLKSDESRRDRYGITLYTRTDKFPVGKELVKGDRSLNLNLQTQLLSNPRHQFTLDATFRSLKADTTVTPTQKSDKTILGRAQYLVNEWKGMVTGNVLYEVGAGQEQKRDYAYLEVPAGQGQYVWNDYDSNGVQSLNEFELAAFPDQAKYIRVYTPTNVFVKANYTTFNYSFILNPHVLLPGTGLRGMRKLASLFILQSSMQISKKSLASGNFEFNPFKYGLHDTALITLSTTMLNTLSFNRYSTVWGIDLSNLRNGGKSLLTYGYESRKQNNWTMKLRWNLSRTFTFTMNSIKGLEALFTPAFANRNYQLNEYTLEPKLELISATVFRISAGYSLNTKKNLSQYGGEKALSNSVNLETKYNVLQNSSINAKFTFNQIGYKYPANTTVSYVMLNGLLPGQNYLWTLTFTKRLLNNLELNFQYDGRKSGTARTVHVGRASLTALF
ncbi:MAG TPA: hypothetical protein VG870_11230 [Chitinophagaceae bacterium]|nr:hypothetical protein [Chitinophagaceae bacterium]